MVWVGNEDKNEEKEEEEGRWGEGGGGREGEERGEVRKSGMWSPDSSVAVSVDFDLLVKNVKVYYIVLYCYILFYTTLHAGNVTICNG